MPQQTNHKHPAFANFDNRLNTFANWPRLEVITPNELAAAGFFFEGPCDSVKCYSCGGGIRNWEAGDDPWVIHAESFPWCSFVLTEKGLAYIEEHSKDNDHQLLGKKEMAQNLEDFPNRDFSPGVSPTMPTIDRIASISKQFSGHIDRPVAEKTFQDAETNLYGQTKSELPLGLAEEILNLRDDYPLVYGSVPSHKIVQPNAFHEPMPEFKTYRTTNAEAIQPNAFHEPLSEFKTFRTTDTEADKETNSLQCNMKQKDGKAVASRPQDLEVIEQDRTQQRQAVHSESSESLCRLPAYMSVEKVTDFFAKKGKRFTPIDLTGNSIDDFSTVSVSELKEACKAIGEPIRFFSAGNATTTSSALNTLQTSGNAWQGQGQLMPDKQSRSNHVAGPIRNKVSSVPTYGYMSTHGYMSGNQSKPLVQTLITPVSQPMPTRGRMQIPNSQQAPAHRSVPPEPPNDQQNYYTVSEELKHALQSGINDRKSSQNQGPTNPTDPGDRYHPYQRPLRFQKTPPNLPEFK